MNRVDKHILWEVRKAAVEELKIKVDSLTQLYEEVKYDNQRSMRELTVVEYIKSTTDYLDQLLTEERVS